MSAYLVVSISAIHDLDRVIEYRKQALPTVQKYGGESIANSTAKFEHLEGNAPSAIVLFRFPSFEDALAWYRSPEYQECVAIRQGAADVQISLIDGIEN